MVAILGANFHEKKLVKKALESFYGLGPQASARIMAKYTIHPLARMGTIPAKTVTALTAELSNMTIENDARRIVQDNIKRLRDMATYRGVATQWAYPSVGNAPAPRSRRPRSSTP
ncbi:hypothetical protein EKO27_g3852 [Xylaria grammica]|uniref:30S ribosomal protein S13 n=1 Tax=Xylaria grammica TaxID=363999 RepID=A0A439DA65_9PEZI|nr:hypothetical protein EKO27_g3852 [Xylaria grammica]